MFYGVALGSSTSATFNVATLTSTGPGQILFSQFFSLTSGYHALDINTGNLNLLADTTYAAYVDPVSPGVANIEDHFDGTSGTDYSDGHLIWFQNSAGWFADSDFDLAFRATFIPEPQFALLFAPLLPFLQRRRGSIGASEKICFSLGGIRSKK
jgi:hypothetical protein